MGKPPYHTGPNGPSGVVQVYEFNEIDNDWIQKGDDIYGTENSGRYVCESRLYKMLDHEYDLMLDRLSAERPECRLFAFAE